MRNHFLSLCSLLVGVALLGHAAPALAQGQVTAKRLLTTGTLLADKRYYLEALDLFDEAKGMLEREGKRESGLYADVRYALAQTKIKGRLHQSFPAYYVKTALEDVRATNEIRERISGVLPQKLAQGYYLEGVIHKRFFMRRRQAISCFLKAVNIDPGSVAAKRELSEVTPAER